MQGARREADFHLSSEASTEQHASRHSQLSFRQEQNDETVVGNKIARPSFVPEF